MQQENLDIKNTAHTGDEDLERKLIEDISQIYMGSTTQKVKEAEQKLIACLSNNFRTLEIVYKFLKPSYQVDKYFKTVCSILIKVVYSKIANNQYADKQPYLAIAHELLLTTNYEHHSIKETIRGALEHIFSATKNSQCRMKWKEQIKEELIWINQQFSIWSIQTIQKIHGNALILIAILNSFSKLQEQINFVQEMCELLCKLAILCAQHTKINVQSKISISMLSLGGGKIVQFFKISMQKLIEEQDFLKLQICRWKDAQSFYKLIAEYLFLFCQDNTLISKYSPLNLVKHSILQILYLISMDGDEINLDILGFLLNTLITSSNSISDFDDDSNQDESENEKINGQIISIFQSQLANQKHFHFFMENKMKILTSLLIYCRTTPNQESYMIGDPQKFVEMAQYFSQIGILPYSLPIKIKASNFLRTLTSKVDQSLRIVVKLCIDLIAMPLKIPKDTSQFLDSPQKEYLNYEFRNLTTKNKLDNAFMVLTALFQQINNRPDLKALVMTFLKTNFQAITKSSKQLVIIRIIRLTGYYPTPIYLEWVQQFMDVSRVFLREGLNCFERVLSNKEYFNTFPTTFMAYVNIMEYIKVLDPIFQKLIRQNYESILVKNEKLYHSVCNKIQNTFQQALVNQYGPDSKHTAMMCLVYFESMLQKQNRQHFLSYLDNLYTNIQAKGLGIEQLQDNFIGIFSVLLSKSNTVTQKIQSFVKQFSKPSRLHHYSKRNQFFSLLNNLIVKSNKSLGLIEIYYNLIFYVGQTQNEKFNFEIVPCIAHSIGHILISTPAIEFDDNFIKYLLQIIFNQKKNTSLALIQPWYKFLSLHYLYSKAYQMRSFLIYSNAYEVFLRDLFNTTFDSKIERKVAVMASQELLSHETDPKIQHLIIRFCISTLNQQKNQYFSKLQKKKTKTKRMSSKQEIDAELQQERIQNESKENQFDNYDPTYGLKHPFYSIDEFIAFRHQINSINKFIQLSQDQLSRLNQILQYEWHKNAVRKVLKIANSNI